MIQQSEQTPAWLMWLKRITIIYICVGFFVGLSFMGLSGFDIDWEWSNIKLFISIVMLWPLWVWFIVVMWLSHKQRG